MTLRCPFLIPSFSIPSVMKTLEDVLRDEHESIKRESIDPHADLKQVHRRRNHADYFALCLSGGGIRSATFNLGILQGLARRQKAEADDKLQTLDYLSTVSGGGFIGGWYSAWKHRDLNKTPDLNEPLAKLAVPEFNDPSQVEPKPVEHLRSFSNYLSPSVGLLSADFWTLVAIYLRNLCLINAVLAPVILAALMIPRILYALMNVRLEASVGRTAILGSLLALALATGAYAVWRIAQNLSIIGSANDSEFAFLKRILIPLSISAVCAVTACAWYVRLDSAHTRLYVSFAFPLLFILLMGIGTIIAGLTSRHTTENDEEWWARAGAWMMIVLLAWVTMCVLVLWAPDLILRFLELAQTPSRLMESWMNIALTLAPIIGVLSTILSLAGGFTSTTPSGDEKQSKVGTKAWLVLKATSLLASVALIFILATFAALTGPLLLLLGVAGNSNIQWNQHVAILDNSGLGALIAATLIMFGAAQLFAVFIDTNKFSLHYFWRNRIVRAYLGASRDHTNTSTMIAFTGFDPADNLKMTRLRKQRPFHVINIALNLVASKKLSWQERLAESFTVSPLHCGTHWLGYRDSETYGKGISLGNAVALSGAAASPNMGYMMTSPVVRFLMTMFNVRLGSWMGNPGPHGDGTFDKHAPKNILKPILLEALGQTDDESPYVYLSDGGHFENLGLYEMVLRRCRFIIVSDASTDATYSYESLAQATRKIRVDFGIPIDFNPFPDIIGRTKDGSGVHCAVGTIGYSQVDRECKDGILLYVKPSLVKDEPRDIINYLSESADFPQESIADQFFSESQFESYRMLGFVIAQRLFKSGDLRADLVSLRGGEPPTQAFAAKA